MAPRATVQQAIELLKIHQLRRENAAIYSQIQILQDQVVALRNANADTQKQLGETQVNLQKTHTLSVQNHNHFGKIKVSIEELNRDRVDLQSSIKGVQEQCEGLFESAQTRALKLLNRIETLRTSSKDAEAKQEAKDRIFEQDIDAMRRDVAQKINADQYRLIETRLNQIERDARPILTDHHSIASTSRVHDSMAKDAGSIVNDSSLEKSTMTDDLDLDERAATFGHDRTPNECNDSLVMLPYNVDKEAEHINQIVALQQDPEEGLPLYIQRCCALFEDLTEASESILVHRLVRGLSRPKQRQAFRTWLDATSWSKENLQDIACLHGVSRAEMSTHLQPDPQSARKSTLENASPEILVLRTESVRQDTEHNGDKLKQLNIVSQKLEPRRSQRIAARTQGQCQTQTSERLETETQAEALNIRIALATRNDPVSAHSSYVSGRSRSKECKVVAETSKGAIANPVGKRPVKHKPGEDEEIEETEYSIGRSRRRNDTTFSPQHTAFLTLPDVDVAVLAGDNIVQTPNPPETPRKRLFSRKARVLPQTPIGHIPSPLCGKKGQARVVDVERVRPMSMAPSIQNSKPRLVSEKQKVKRQLVDETSDSDVFLPPLVSRAAQTASNPRSMEPPDKKRRRRLPPPAPPEIPILSTSTEEDRRFNKW